MQVPLEIYVESWHNLKKRKKKKVYVRKETLALPA